MACDTVVLWLLFFILWLLLVVLWIVLCYPMDSAVFPIDSVVLSYGYVFYDTDGEQDKLSKTVPGGLKSLLTL